MDAPISPKDEVKVRILVEAQQKNSVMKQIGFGYFATEEGQIYSSKKNKYIRQRTSINGYRIVNLSINGKCKTYSVHRLIAQAFIANETNLPVVNHIDGNKQNNNVSNLEWTSMQGNAVHARNMGLISYARGMHTKNGKFTPDTIIEIRNLFNKGVHSQYELAKIYDVSRSAIQQIVTNKTYAYVY